jgi:hypothetical protein
MVMDESTDMGFPLTALREIKYLSILDHDNIVRIKQVLSSKRKPYAPSFIHTITFLFSKFKKQIQRQLLPLV